MKVRRPPDDPGEGPRPIRSTEEPVPVFPEAEVPIHVVPGLVRCPVCRARLEVTIAGADLEQLRSGPVSHGAPLPISRGGQVTPREGQDQ